MIDYIILLGINFYLQIITLYLFITFYFIFSMCDKKNYLNSTTKYFHISIINKNTDQIGIFIFKIFDLKNNYFQVKYY